MATLRGIQIFADTGELRPAETLKQADSSRILIDKLLHFLATPIGSWPAYPTWGSITATYQSGSINMKLALALQTDLNRFADAMIKFLPQIMENVRSLRLVKVEEGNPTTAIIELLYKDNNKAQLKVPIGGR